MPKPVWGDARIEGPEIVIRVGIEALERALNLRPDGLGKQFRISDVPGFAKELVNELNNGDEQGVSAVHALFDGAMEAVIDSGSLHVDEITVANV